MKWVKSFTRRTAMTILFLAALLMTYQSFSGVEAKNIVNWIHTYNNNDMLPYLLQNDVGYSNGLNKRGNNLQYKTLKLIDAEKTQISSSEAVSSKPPSLEEAFDWTKYPKLSVVATGYTAGYESTGKNPGHPEYGITYSGVKVKRDLYSTVAADLNKFPLGTILFIPGYGYGVVADKGSAIKGNKIDLYYETVEDVYSEWGKKSVEVFVVKAGKGSLTEEELAFLNENESMQVFRQQVVGSRS